MQDILTEEETSVFQGVCVYVEKGPTPKYRKNKLIYHNELSEALHHGLQRIKNCTKHLLLLHNLLQDGSHVESMRRSKDT